MTTTLRACLLAVVAALAAPLPGKAARPAAAETQPQSPHAWDLAGVWERRGSINFDPTIPFSLPDRPPLTARAAEQFKATLAGAAAGRPYNDPHADCVPLGMPRMMNMPYLFEIIVSDDRLTLIAEEQSQVRRIWTDGSDFPEDMSPGYVGWSVGHWEGEVLVVETRGLRADIPINQKGLMHSRNPVGADGVTSVQLR